MQHGSSDMYQMLLDNQTVQETNIKQVHAKYMQSMLCLQELKVEPKHQNMQDLCPSETKKADLCQGGSPFSLDTSIAVAFSQRVVLLVLEPVEVGAPLLSGKTTCVPL